MKIAAIIQARMGSTRLPGKVLLPLAGTPVLSHVVSRVRMAAAETWVATSTHTADDAIEQHCRTLGVACFRGSETDVLSRYYECAKQSDADAFMRITADCPLSDPALMQAMMKRFAEFTTGKNYLSNTLTRSYPKGLDVEIFSRVALEAAHDHAQTEYEREHVTPYMYQSGAVFTHNQENTKNDSQHRLVLDTEADYRLLFAVFEALYKGVPFSYNETLAYMKAHPELSQLNAHLPR